jgi:hypothetical protein
MNRIYKLPEDDLRGGLYRRIYLLIRKDGWTWQSVSAAIGIAGGMLSVLFGLMLWATVRFLAPVGISPTLNTVSNLFFALLLPLLVLAAYCLDLLEKKPPTLPLPAKPQPAHFRRMLRLRLRHPHNN